MGNKETKGTHDEEVVRGVKNNYGDEVSEAVFEQLASGQVSINEQTFTQTFGDYLGSSIYRYFSKESDAQVDKKCFVSRSKPFFATGVNFYYTLLIGNDENLDAKQVSSIIDSCAKAAKVRVNSDSDQKFMKSLTDSAVRIFVMNSSGNCSSSEFKSWVEGNCPRLISNLQRNLISTMKTGQPVGPDVCVIIDSQGPSVSSKLLSSFQIWFMQCCIPLSFTTATARTGGSSSSFTWSILYSSLEHGLSPNRFETKVFNYRSPTVLFLQMNDGKSYCIGVDVEWRQGAQSFGGSDCFIYELAPKFKLLDSGSNLIFFNLKLRTVTNGLVIGKNQMTPSLKIEPDFSNIADIEVWGCGTQETSAAQLDHLNWQKKQAEKHSKVPLPGNWEENPDRSLLEMAGVKVSHAEQ